MIAQPDLEPTSPDPPEPTAVAPARREIIRLHPLISRAATELQPDPELRRAVLIGLMRSLSDDLQPIS